MDNILIIQPEIYRMPLAPKEIHWRGNTDIHSRVINFDPTGVYQRSFMKFNPMKRFQEIRMRDIFPPMDNLCSCGCGKPLTGKQRRWASPECMNFATQVYYIFKGDKNTIYFYLSLYYGQFCNSCHRSIKEIYNQDIKDLPDGHHLRDIDALYVDHILAIMSGGGGAWLGNYQLLCHKCHTKKTKTDLKTNVVTSEYQFKLLI